MWNAIVCLFGGALYLFVATVIVTGAMAIYHKVMRKIKRKGR